jgi:hypothetical protein
MGHVTGGLDQSQVTAECGRGLRRCAVGRAGLEPARYTTPVKATDAGQIFEYALTPLGSSLVEPLTELTRWAEDSREHVENHRTIFDA